MTSEEEDLFVRTVQALVVANEELGAIEAFELPPPDRVIELLREREALAATLASVPEDERKKLRLRYQGEKDRVDRITPKGAEGSQRIAVDPEVGDKIATMLEELRRAALTGQITNEVLVQLGVS